MASRFQLPPIVKAAEQLLVDIENAVRRFPCYHRNAIGKKLRKAAMKVYTLAGRAWFDRARQAHWVEKLRWAIDKVKERLQISKELHALASFNQFEMLWRQAAALGAQAGGWHRHQADPQAQNVPGPRAVAQRGQKLSTRAASADAGANP